MSHVRTLAIGALRGFEVKTNKSKQKLLKTGNDL